METLWETLQQFFSTLGTLGRAQSILVPLLASWIFTVMWVYATERKRHGTQRLGRAWLGLFWLPGLLIYYLFQGDPVSTRPRGESLTFRRTPRTLEAPRSPRQKPPDDKTFDGITRTGGISHTGRDSQKTDDGAARGARASAPPAAARPAPTPFFLEVLNGDLKGRRLEAPPGLVEVGIGSRGNNTIRVQDPSIAPWHVLLTYEKTGQWTLRVVEHAMEKYHTQVNGRAAKVLPLQHRDEIQLGNLRLRFNLPFS